MFKKKVLPLVYNISPMLGCDPEFFFKLDGEVVGAEKFIPVEGIKGSTSSEFIIDGVQAELNPRPNTCRALLGNEIAACFKILQKEMAKKDKEGKSFTCDFSRTVEISKDKLMELNEESRKFGCAPSKSIYAKSAGLKIKEVDATEYRTRAAGGHIHFGGTGSYPQLKRAYNDHPEKTVEMLDLICANTCVLIDRDDGNKERRKLYGKAGEYRQPAHGLEYRTLSNFWLTAYPLMSCAFGLARLAVLLMADTPKKTDEYYKAFTSKVSKRKVISAINTNNFDLAMDNFMAIEQLLLEVTTTEYDTDRFPLTKTTMEQFHHFVDVVQNKGLTYWFPQDPITHWVKHGECHTNGFYDFLRITVNEEMKKNKKTVPIEVKLRVLN